MGETWLAVLGTHINSVPISSNQTPTAKPCEQTEIILGCADITTQATMQPTHHTSLSEQLQKTIISVALAETHSLLT